MREIIGIPASLESLVFNSQVGVVIPQYIEGDVSEDRHVFWGVSGSNA